MKLTPILALILTVFLVNPAHAKTTSLRYAKLDVETLSDLITDAKAILQEGEANQLFSQNQKRNFELMNEAFAASNAYDCFYAGWPSQLKSQGAKRFCTSPKNNPDYPAKQCASNELACNPVLFGLSHCVQAGTAQEKSTTFSRCESQFKKSPNGYGFLKNLNAAQSKTLENTLSMVRDVCEKGSIGTQKSTRMCVQFLAKVDRLTESQIYKDAAPRIKADQQSGAIRKTTQNETQTGSESKVTVAQNIQKKTPECCTAPSAPAGEPSVKGISEIKNAIQKNSTQSVRDLYDALKKQYESSPVCRIQSVMTDEEKMMNGLSHYTQGLANLVDSTEPQDAFVQKTIQELGLDQSLAQAYSQTQGQSAAVKRAFKYQLAQKIIDQLKSNPNAMNNALEGSFTDRKMANCQFVSFDAFENAMKGHDKLKSKLAGDKKGVITIVDYTLPYSARRMFVIDVDKQQTLHNTWVSLGGGGGKMKLRPDGSNPPTSGESGSMMSSEGFAITGEEYSGMWGKSVRIDGVDQNNKSMRSRAVVLHAWPQLPFAPYNQYKAYYPDLPKRVEKLANHQVSTDPNQLGEIDSILNGVETQMSNIRVQYTDGCLGIPQVTTPAGVSSDLIRKAVSGKSLIYMFTGKDQSSIYL